MAARKRDLSKEEASWEPRFGARVKRERERLGLSQLALTRQLGLSDNSRVQVIRWERGQKPNAANLAKLAGALDTTVHDLTKGIWPTAAMEVVERRVDDLSDRLAELEDAVGHRTKGRGRAAARELERLQKSQRPAGKPRATRSQQGGG